MRDKRKQKNSITVGELKEKLNEFPDNLEVFIYPKYNMRRHPYGYDEYGLVVENISGVEKKDRVRLIY